MRIVAPKSLTLAGLLLALPVHAAAGPDLPGAARALLAGMMRRGLQDVLDRLARVEFED